MIINKLRNILLIAIVFATTSYAQNLTFGPASRESDTTYEIPYPVKDKNGIIAPSSGLIDYTRNCDYPADVIISIKYTYE